MVAARETSLLPILEGSKQYRVPLYQRPYKWGKPQLKTLWDDVVQLAGDRQADLTATHFMGSLVLAPSPGDVTSVFVHHLVVDGQQRLTTLTLLLCAIRDAYKASDSESVDARRIQDQLLTNQYRTGDDHFKLVPTQADRASYVAVVNGSAGAGGDDAVGEAYRFFSARLNGLVSDASADNVISLAQVEEAVNSGISVVLIQTDLRDNVHRIFESLNNTGLKLSQADLIRNYLFMRMPTKGQLVYEQYWKPLQDMLPGGQLETFFWLDLLRANVRAKINDTYSGQQRQLERLKSEEEIVAETKRFHDLGSLYHLIVHPQSEADPAVRFRLQRMDAWGSATPAPLLLHFLAERAAGRATSDEVARAIHVVESYIVRRFISATRSQGLNRILAQAVAEMDSESSLPEAVHTYLSAGRKHFAGDAQIRAAVGTTAYYLNGRPGHRKLVLMWLEDSFGSNEPVDLSAASIEHVMPQTLSSAWLEELGADVGDDDVAEVHARLVHTLGNLTLSGYNTSMSNKPFDTKKVELRKTGVRLSQEIAEKDHWGPTEIGERAFSLAERIISYWPGPGEQTNAEEPNEVWLKLEAVLAEVPTGRWTTYGDLATILGTAAQPIGNRLASTKTANAHRVLKRGGVVAEKFAWVDAADSRDPRNLLEEEGIRFDANGRADAAQKLTLEEIADLANDEIDDH